MSNVDPENARRVDMTTKVGDKIENVVNPPTHAHISVSTRYKEDPTLNMQAAEWHGSKDIRVVTRPAPDITDPADAIIKVTSLTVCGSDLHMYFAVQPMGASMRKGDIVGHESMGVIVKVGSDVKKMKVGQRVVISAPISCGTCEFCKQERYSLCDTTNPSTAMESLYGGRTAGLFGYSHLTGGFAGGQAEYCRVPFADVNLLPVPDNLNDRQVLYLSDVLCTAWHGNVLAKTGKGSIVAVWGAGPIGLTTCYLAKFRGATTIVSIDHNPARLEIAKSKAGATHTINFADTPDVVAELQKLIPGGPTNCIDCVGFRFPKSWSTWLSQTMRLQSDATESIQEMIKACRKGANLALIGDYFNTTNNFPIGVMMEKGLNVSGGQLYCQQYWGELLGYIQKGQIDITWLISHEDKLANIAKAYELFGQQADAVTKYFIQTDYGLEYERQHPTSTTSTGRTGATGA